MAGADRMTIEEVVRQVMVREHGDVVRDGARGGVRGADGGRGVASWSAPSAASAGPRIG